jgi:hypothetical protein
MVSNQMHSEHGKPSPWQRCGSLLQLSFQQLYLSRKRAVGGHQILDLSDGMQHSGMIAAAETPSDFR